MTVFHIPEPVPAQGVPVPIDAIESSFRMLGFIPGTSRNDLSSRLVLYPTRLEVKVAQTTYHEYTALKRVDYEPEGFLRREKVILSFHDDNTTYYVKPSSAAVARELLRFCHRRGFALTAEAQQALGA